MTPEEKAKDFLRRKKIDIAVSIPDWEIIKSAVYIACEETRKEVEKEFALTPLDYLARQEIKEIIIKNEDKVRVETAKKIKEWFIENVSNFADWDSEYNKRFLK